jgi:hypothetical protein
MTDHPTELSEAEMRERMDLDLQTGVGNLEDARMLLHDGQRFIRRGGAPAELQAEYADLYERIQSLEARLGGYAVEVAA